MDFCSDGSPFCVEKNGILEKRGCVKKKKPYLYYPEKKCKMRNKWGGVMPESKPKGFDP